MTPFPYSIEEDAPVDAARDLMWEHEIHHLPVKRNSELIGVVSERDIGLALASRPHDDPASVTVREVYTADAYTADLDTRLDLVLATMAEQQIGSTLVTRRGKLVGIFTANDACAAFADHLREHFPAPPEDTVA